MAQTKKNIPLRGVVYDVGLHYSKEAYSVDSFNLDLVKYDMAAIANDSHANTVRIEGEDISRLVSATEVAYAIGLKVRSPRQLCWHRSPDI